jgi:hypothetical protein
VAAPVVHATQATTGNASAGSNTFTANYPASVAQGDLLILQVTSWIDATPSAPTGWTLVTSTSHTFHRNAVYWREAPASPGTSVGVPYSSSGTNPFITQVTRISGHRPGTPIDGFGSNTGNNMPCNAPSLTPTGTERRSFIAGSFVTSSPITTSPSASGYTTLASSTQGNLKAAGASRELTSTSATGSVDFNFGQHFQFAHIHLLIAPQQAQPVTLTPIAPATTLHQPGVVLFDRAVTVGQLGPTATLFDQRIQPGDEFITLPEWVASDGGGLDYTEDEPYRSDEDYRSSSEVVGTRLFAPEIVAGQVTFTVPLLTSGTVFDPAVIIADVDLPVQHIAAATVVFDPGVTDGLAIDLGGFFTAVLSSTTLFDPAIVAGDVTATVQLIAETVLFPPGGFDQEIPLPHLAATTVLFAPVGGTTIEVPLIATTIVLTPFIGQYNVIPEPDEAVWGASGGYSARIDILDPGGDVVASTGSAASGIVLVSGSINEDITQAVTRECTVRLLLENTADGSRHPLLPAKPGDPLDPRTGGALAIYAGPIRPSGAPALVKLGVFKIVSASPSSEATGDSLSIRGLSEETSIAAAPFFDVFAVSAGTPITQVIGNMVTQAVPNVRIHVESTGITSPQFSFAEGDNRLTRVQELAASIGMVARFDREGRFRVQHAAEYGDTEFTSPRWVFTEGAGAVMRDVSRDLDDSELHNGVIVVGEPLDTNTDPVRFTLWDTNPNSPVYYNPNNPGASRVGPRPKKIVSPLVYTVEQAQAVAIVTLTQLLAFPDQISVTVAANPHIEAGDLARIVRTTMGVDGLYEVRSISHDLLGAASTATCVARV